MRVRGVVGGGGEGEVDSWTTFSTIHRPLMVFSHQSKTTTRQRQDNDKTKVEPAHSYDAFHTRHVGPGVKGIIGMHRFNICLVVVLLSCSGVKAP